MKPRIVFVTGKWAIKQTTSNAWLYSYHSDTPMQTYLLWAQKHWWEGRMMPNSWMKA